MQQVYWEAKQSFNKLIGQREDNYIVSSDNELDARLELLQTADNSFNSLMKTILKYCSALQDLVSIQENFGMALIEYGTKDFTAAGKVMCMSGKALSKAAQRQIQLKTYLMNLFHEVQTFQFKATTDALQSVAKMEKVRKSYRSGLMWLKNESKDLDPDVTKKLRNFRKVQDHIKRLKVKFDGVKLESMQKIDLFLLSRSNLFSYNLLPYSKAYKKICKSTVAYMDFTLNNIPLCLSYNFVALKELNQYSKTLQGSLQKMQSSNAIFMQQNTKNNSTSSFSDESANLHPLSEHSSNSKKSESSSTNIRDVKKDILDSSSVNKPSVDAPLIDLNDDDNNQSLADLLIKNNNPLTLKYSDDLFLINFGNYQESYSNEYLTDKFDENKGCPLMNEVPENKLAKENGDLQFWSLLQNYKKSSGLMLTEADNSRLIGSKHSSFTTSDSRWDDILVQFDPFLEEMSDRKVSNEYLELC